MTLLERWRLLAWRGLVADRRWALGLAGVVALTAAAAAAFPPLYTRAQNDSLQHEAVTAPPRERDLEVVQAARLPADELPAAADERLRLAPAALQRLAAERELAVDTPTLVARARTGSPEPPGTARFVTVRSYDDLERVRLVRGNEPAADGALVEILVSAPTADALSVVPGDTLRLEPNPEHPALQSVPLAEQVPLEVRVSGVFEAAGATEQWFGDTRPLRPRVEETETRRLVFAYALAPRAAYERVLRETESLPFTYLWRYRLEGERLTAAGLGDVEAAARTLALRFPAVPEFGATEPAARTGIGRIAERFRAQQRIAGAGLSFAAAALLGLALVVVLAVALAGGDAQRRALVVARDRGGSPSVAAAVLAAAVVVPAAVFGGGLALLAAGATALGALLAVALAVVATLATAAAVAPRPRPPQDPVIALEARAARARRRAAVEASLVVLALACVVVLRSRAAPAGGFDGLAALTPVLVVLALAAATVRLAPVAAGLAATRLRRRPDLAPALALRRVARRGALGAPIVAVPLVAAAVTVFAALTTGSAAGDAPLLRTLEDALGLASWLSTAYALAAVGMLVLVLGSGNAEEDARLGALGLRRGPRLALAVLQFVPPVAAGTVVGVGAGVLAHVAVRVAFAAEGVALAHPAAVAALLALPAVAAAAAIVSARRSA